MGIESKNVTSEDEDKIFRKNVDVLNNELRKEIKRQKEEAKKARDKSSENIKKIFDAWLGK